VEGMAYNILAKPKTYQLSVVVSRVYNILAKPKPILYQWKVWYITFWQNLNLLSNNGGYGI
jgi:hypothetical protein